MLSLARRFSRCKDLLGAQIEKENFVVAQLALLAQLEQDAHSFRGDLVDAMISLARRFGRCKDLLGAQIEMENFFVAQLAPFAPLAQLKSLR